jgi:hypothetical protein
MLVWVNGAPRVGGGDKITDRRTDHLEPGPDSHLLSYSISDRASHIYLRRPSRPSWELSSVVQPYTGFWWYPYTTRVWQEYGVWTMVLVPVVGAFSPGELMLRAPSFLPRARLLSARKPTHISHPQSEAYQLDQRGRWWEQLGERYPRGPYGIRLPPQRG